VSLVVKVLNCHHPRASAAVFSTSSSFTHDHPLPLPLTKPHGPFVIANANHSDLRRDIFTPPQLPGASGIPPTLQQRSSERLYCLRLPPSPSLVIALSMPARLEMPAIQRSLKFLKRVFAVAKSPWYHRPSSPTVAIYGAAVPTITCTEPRRLC
jgi:hypothetical protein